MTAQIFHMVPDMSFYVIERILNNNVVVASNERRERVIVTGRAVGFGHRQGDVLRGDEIGKLYVPRDENADRRMEALFSEIPFSCVKAAERIVDFASAALGQSFSQSLTISLADHIAFAVAQHREGTYRPNLLAEEIERLYPAEFIAGIQGLRIIQQEVGVALDQSEAGSIAFHIINNSGSDGMSIDTAKIISGVNGMLDLIRREMGIELPVDSSRYARLVTHLKFLMRRVITAEQHADDAGELYLNFDEEQVPGISRCLDALEHYLAEQFGYVASNAERLYLFVHIVSIAQLG